MAADATNRTQISVKVKRKGVPPWGIVARSHERVAEACRELCNQGHAASALADIK